MATLPAHPTPSQAAHLANLTDAAREALLLSIPERCQFIMRDRYIVHEQIRHIFKFTNSLINAPRRSRARGLVISGEAGAGKTALADALLRRYPHRPSVDGMSSVLPVARITLTGARVASEIYVRTMEGLGVPHAERYRGKDACREVVRFLRQSGLRALIVDEVQDVMNRTKLQQAEALESIKYIMNETRISIIALGTDEAERAVSCDQHLRARFTALNLPNWRAGEHLANFLSELERCLPLAEPSRLASPGMMKTLIQISGGVLDVMLTLINYAACLALEAGQERITEAFLRAADTEIPAFFADVVSDD